MQVEAGLSWSPGDDFLAGLRVDHFGSTVLSATGITHSWTDFNVDIEKMMQDNNNDVEDRISKMVFTGVTTAWWRLTVRENDDFIKEALTKALKE